jgi:hypothetical protein
MRIFQNGFYIFLWEIELSSPIGSIDDSFSDFLIFLREIADAGCVRSLSFTGKFLYLKIEWNLVSVLFGFRPTVNREIFSTFYFRECTVKCNLKTRENINSNAEFCLLLIEKRQIRQLLVPRKFHGLQY